MLLGVLCRLGRVSSDVGRPPLQAVDFVRERLTLPYPCPYPSAYPPLQAVDFVRERLARGAHPRAVCEDLCSRCLAPDTEGSEGKGCDNMSAMVVTLRAFSPFAAAAAGQAPAVDLAALPQPPTDPDAAVVGARRWEVSARGLARPAPCSP